MSSSADVHIRATEFRDSWKRRQDHETVQGLEDRHTADMLALSELLVAMSEILAIADAEDIST